jgi:WD40 repeat protein
MKRCRPFALPLLAAAVAATSVAAVPAAGAGAARVRTLAVLPGPVASFAQAGERIAWMGCDRRVSVRSLRTQRDTLLARPAGNVCGSGPFHHRLQEELAFDGTRVVWAERSFSNNGLYHVFAGAATNDRVRRSVGGASAYVDHPGQSALFDPGRGLIAGTRGALLFYSFCDYDCWTDDSVSGEVMRVAGRGARPLAEGPEETRLLDLEASGTRFATVHNELRGWGASWSSEPAWSPDGEQIVFTASPPGGAGRDLYVVAARGGPPRRLTETPEDERDPDWSPDGRRIAATVRARGGPSGVVVFDASTGAATRLADGRAATWSPDGTRLAFARAIDGGRSEIRLLDVARREETLVVTRPHETTDLAWSPDAHELAVATGLSLEIVSVDGGRVRTLRQPAATVDWSPDGRFLLVTVEAAGSYPPSAATIAVVPVDGSSIVTPTLPHGEWDVAGAWSPDGRRLAFASTRAFSVPERASELYVEEWSGRTGRAAGRASKAVTPEPKIVAVADVRRLSDGRLVTHVERPGWAGRAVALSSRVGAILTQRGGVRRLELFDSRTGRSLGSVPAPRGLVADPKATGDTIFYRVGTTIWALDVRTKRTRVLARAGGRPIGLSVDGRRLAWAENRGGRAYVRAVELAP